MHDTKHAIDLTPTRVDIELYLDRLDRSADRLADDVEAARRRIEFARIDRAAADELTACDEQLLAAVGVVQAVPESGDDKSLITRRLRQLEALERLRSVVEACLAAITKNEQGGVS